MKILLAVDGSAYTKKMLAYLAAHDELLGNTHSYSVISVQAALPARARAALGKSVVDKYYAEEGDKIISPVVKFLARKAIEPERIVKVGPAGETIAQVADEGKFDLLVMGSRGHGALATLVVGSVTMKVLSRCSVPVLIVP